MITALIDLPLRFDSAAQCWRKYLGTFTPRFTGVSSLSSGFLIFWFSDNP